MVTHVLHCSLDISPGCPTDSLSHCVQQWTKLLLWQSPKSGWGHSQRSIFLCSSSLLSRIPFYLAPYLFPFSLLTFFHLLFWHHSWVSAPLALYPVSGWRVFVIYASGPTQLICSIIYRTANLSMSELLNKYQWGFRFGPWPAQNLHSVAWAGPPRVRGSNAASAS